MSISSVCEQHYKVNYAENSTDSSSNEKASKANAQKAAKKASAKKASTKKSTSTAASSKQKTSKGKPKTAAAPAMTLKTSEEQTLRGYAEVVNDLKLHPSMLGCFVSQQPEGRLLTLDVNASTVKKTKLGDIMNGMLENPMKLELNYPDDHTFHADPPRIFMTRIKVSVRNMSRFTIICNDAYQSFSLPDGRSNRYSR